MERLDGKNPFDPDTYNRPAGSVTTMLELRAFCAEFFDKRIRNNAETNEPDIQAFLALICHSPNYFARARAVIPELQGPTDVESSDWSAHVRDFVSATRVMKDPSDKQWLLLPEEPVWKELVKEGMDAIAKNFAKYGIEHLKQTSDAGAHGVPVNPIVLVPATAEHKTSDSPLRSAASSYSNPKSFTLPLKLDLSNIPVFIPRNPVGSEELVWSPTTGSRKPRPDEIYQQSTQGHPKSPMEFGQGVSPNARSGYNVRNQYLFHGSRDFSDSPPTGHRHSDSIRRTPPPEFVSTRSPLNPAAEQPPRSYEIPKSTRERGNNPNQMPFPDIVDRMTEMTPLSRDPSKHPSSSYHDGTEYPTNHPSRTDSPSQLTGPRFPPSQARGVYGAEPFSASPSAPSYGQPHRTGQGMHRGHPSSFQDELGRFDSRPAASPSHSYSGQLPYAHNPDDWNPNQPRSYRRPRRGALPNQLPHQIIQPISQTMRRAPFPQSTPLPQQLNPDVLIVPPPGSMAPLEYWDMLHQREAEIRTRLDHARRPMNNQEQEYVSLLAEARMNAAATQMPPRNNMSKREWLKELDRTLRGIWNTGPTGAPFSDIVVARKSDFVRAVQREMEWTKME